MQKKKKKVTQIVKKLSTESLKNKQHWDIWNTQMTFGDSLELNIYLDTKLYSFIY